MSDTLLVPEGQTRTAMSDKELQDAVDAAIWVTCSPHEWVWTRDQQVAMAHYVLYASQRLGIIKRIADNEAMDHPKSNHE